MYRIYDMGFWKFFLRYRLENNGYTINYFATKSGARRAVKNYEGYKGKLVWSGEE